MTVAVFESDLNQHRFLRLYFSVLGSVLISIEKIYQTLKTVLGHISKHLEARQKCSTTRRIFISHLGIWKCGETRSFVLDILLRSETLDPWTLREGHFFIVLLCLSIVFKLIIVTEIFLDDEGQIETFKHL